VSRRRSVPALLVVALVALAACSTSDDDPDAGLGASCRAFEINDAQLAEATTKHRDGLVSKTDVAVYDQAIVTVDELMRDPALPESLYEKMLDASLTYVATRREAALIADSWDWRPDKVGRIFDQRTAAADAVKAECDKLLADG
jgi:hypothetical protein